MINPLKNVKERPKVMSEDDIPRIHHELMCCYGWIPYDEFRNLPIHVILRLHKLVQEEKKAEYEWKKTLLKAHGAKVK